MPISYQRSNFVVTVKNRPSVALIDVEENSYNLIPAVPLMGVPMSHIDF